jgi:hypothetical protein
VERPRDPLERALEPRLEAVLERLRARGLALVELLEERADGLVVAPTVLSSSAFRKSFTSASSARSAATPSSRPRAAATSAESARSSSWSPCASAARSLRAALSSAMTSASRLTCSASRPISRS